MICKYREDKIGIYDCDECIKSNQEYCKPKKKTLRELLGEFKDIANDLGEKKEGGK